MTIKDFLEEIKDLLDLIVPFIIGLTVFVVIWGIFNYVIHGAEEEKRGEAKNFIIYGVVGVFIMLSIWGFVNILYNSFKLDNTITPGQIPQVPSLDDGVDTHT